MFQAASPDRANNISFSRRLSMFLVLAVALLSGMAVVASLWIARAQDELAAENMRRMVSGGLLAAEDRLELLVRDYAHWTEAYDGIRARDMEWIQSNIGDGASEGGSADLMIIVEHGTGANYGWSADSGAEPTADLISPEALRTAMSPLDAHPIDSREAYSTYGVSDGQLWLFSTARVVPWEGIEPGTTDADLPRYVFGFKITDELLGEIGAQFLIDDLRLAITAKSGSDSIPFAAPDGRTIAHAVWTPPSPGAAILRQVVPPLGLVLALVAFAVLVASRYIVRSAERLESALTAARAADKSKTEFLANVSHELRTPMNGVIGVGQLLELTDLDNEQAELLRVLRQSANAQIELIEDLIDFSRIDAGKYTLDLAPFDPARTAREVRDMLFAQAEAKGVELNLDLPAARDLSVLGDRGAFRQIITNLAGNAVKFTEEGSVDIMLSAETRLDQAHLVLRVTDTGPGIDPDCHELIFDRFSQADNSKTRSAGGAGLGLTITKSLIDMMGGTITLDSTPGQGATFEVRIKLETAASDQDAAIAA